MAGKFAQSKEYKARLAAARLFSNIASQIRQLRKERGWTQQQLADNSGLGITLIKRAENPGHSGLTLNSMVRIAAGFNLAFVGRFVPLVNAEAKRKNRE